MSVDRDRLRQWIRQKAEDSGTRSGPAPTLALEELAAHLRISVDALYHLHRESALFRLVTMPDGRRYVRCDEILTLLRRSATRPGLPRTLDQAFHRPEDLAEDIGIPRGDVLRLIRTGEIGAVRVADVGWRVPEEEIERMLRETA
jgi:hypothetical protein